MKTLGILGGLGPESTVDYYKRIISIITTKHPHLAYPEIIIHSVNMNEAMKMVNGRQWTELAEWLLEKLHALHRAGAHFAAIASNTPHIVFDKIAPLSPLPLISIVEATYLKAREMGLSRCGLMGTAITMESDFYQKRFIMGSIELIVPSAEEQKRIHYRIFSEIELGIFKDSTRDELLSITKRMVDEEKIDSLILGCTELPLILTESRFGIPFLNTTAIHCERIVEYCVT